MADVSHRNYTPPDSDCPECPDALVAVYSSLAFSGEDAVFRTPIAVTSPGGLLFYESNTLIDAGWTVLGAGDGLSAYSAVADVITLPGSGANGMNNALAWRCLERPDGGAAIVMQLISTDLGTGSTVSRVRYTYSKGNLFSFVSASATRAPAASDEQHIKGSGTAASPTGHKVCDWLSGSGTNYVLGGADTAAPYGFWFAAFDNGTTASTYGCKHTFMYFPMLGALTADADKYVWQCRGDNVSALTMDADNGVLGDTRTSRCYTPDGSSWSAVSGLAYRSTDEVFPRDTTGPVVPYLHSAHVLFASGATSFFIKGWSSLCAYVGEDSTNVGSANNDMKRVVYNHPEGGTANLIRISGLVLPWNGTIPVVGANTWTNAGTMKVWTLSLAKALVTLV